ncbi:MAG: VWA domain-containing protein, partial [Dehalococcoidales bacterium]|nr:VWA domain-containing protein [Dehalococcoidales bacterium]
PYYRSRAKQPASADDLVEAILDFANAQDSLGVKQLGCQQVFDYYRIKKDIEGWEPGDLENQHHGGLGIIMDDLEEELVLGATPGGDLRLTGTTLNIVIKYLIGDNQKRLSGRRASGFLESAERPITERKSETRRYTKGDVSRDISPRHTLRQIARQKKSLSDTNQRDFRVHTREDRRRKLDIVLCLDTSGSMGFRHKLMYARLMATGLAKLVTERGDRIGIVAFDDRGSATWPLSDSGSDVIISHIAAISADGNTNIGDGIRCAGELLLGQPGHNRKHVILITDGEPTAISQQTYEQLKERREKDLGEEYAILETRKVAVRGVTVSVIHITGDRDGGQRFVADVARAGKGKILKIARLADIKKFFQ